MPHIYSARTAIDDKHSNVETHDDASVSTDESIDRQCPAGTMQRQLQRQAVTDDGDDDLIKRRHRLRIWTLSPTRVEVT